MAGGEPVAGGDLGWQVEPLTPALGARVVGADLSQRTPEGDEMLIGLLARYLVLAFPDQRLTPEQHVELGTIFGEPYIHPFLESVPEHPAILEVAKEPDQRETFGGEHWHADITFRDPPSSVSLLLADQLPPLGGDTLFANQFLAYEALSPGLRATLGPMKAIHVYPGFGEGDPHTTAVHPVVRTHPVVGKWALFVNPAFVTRLEAMTGQESDPILSYLYHHQVRPEF
ncbi:MAG: TauD/TfdA dioxygenase family protein, partial [Acidimicrobiales bacterium]